MSRVDVEIQIRNAQEAASEVDPFYERCGSRGRARPGDIFFMSYAGKDLVGCVRFCVEDGTPLLRTMMIDEGYRRHGIGHRLLAAFEEYLNLNHIRNVYCLPYAHLDRFYGLIGFRAVTEREMPTFLIKRLETYLNNGNQYLCMKRP